ncbi:GNAT family N-acetyltransferase [Paenibacillus sp. D2_2]|uniref:GNAT family N-acetyltransferase n=1 Tax=Paenibacillus sp. D2_2 TaxID=3073092 RepID=UPI002814BFED|nr:GNAT family N-acetyltransferase [Paenibacillus sp. D2_2]WMT39234.1 GNAT family N-acetyltransferase [Paenibacillus sp. D2_2]
MLVNLTDSQWDLEVRELLEDAVYYDPSEVDKVMNQYRTSSLNELYVFEDQEEFIGIIGFMMGEQNQLEIAELVIHPLERLKGYGRGIILETIVLKNPSRITAVTDEEGADFFRNIGFQVIGMPANEVGVERFRCTYEVEIDAEDE